MEQLYPQSEEFLQYVWHKHYFSHSELKTTNNQPVKLIHPGIWNRNQGPDFLDGRVQIGQVKLAGHIEIHLHSQDWYRHKHHLDPGYNGCILHVVFESNGVAILRQDGSVVPELVLKTHIDSTLWHKYDQLRLSEDKIACKFCLDEIDQADKKSYLLSLGEARFMEKVNALRGLLDKNRQNWVQVLWERIAWSLGGRVNRESFLQVARRINHELLRPYIQIKEKLEALLYGASGLLEGKFAEAYPQVLQDNWHHLRRKHRIPQRHPVPLKFLRMHPASFPTIRLSQLGDLLYQFPRLEDLLNPDGWEDLQAVEIRTSPYWEHHIRFGEAREKPVIRRLGQLQKENLVINELGPLAFLYLQQHGRSGVWPLIREKLTQLAPENNRITRKWAAQGFPNEDCLQSQGIIKLARDFCMEKRCLQCEIGQQIVR